VRAPRPSIVIEYQPNRSVKNFGWAWLASDMAFPLKDEESVPTVIDRRRIVLLFRCG
jgi:hypothetical protein